MKCIYLRAFLHISRDRSAYLQCFQYLHPQRGLPSSVIMPRNPERLFYLPGIQEHRWNSLKASTYDEFGKDTVVVVLSET